MLHAIRDDVIYKILLVRFTRLVGAFENGTDNM